MLPSFFFFFVHPNAVCCHDATLVPRFRVAAINISFCIFPFIFSQKRGSGWWRCSSTRLFVYFYFRLGWQWKGRSSNSNVPTGGWCTTDFVTCVVPPDIFFKIPLDFRASALYCAIFRDPYKLSLATGAARDVCSFPFRFIRAELRRVFRAACAAF